MSEQPTGKIVTFELDPDNLSPLTAEQREELEQLRTMKDEDIDFSDIPRQTGTGHWRRPGLSGGPVGELRPAAMKENFLLLEPDVAAFFREDGDRSAERMNAVLREYFVSHGRSA